MVESYVGVAFGHSLVNSLRALFPSVDPGILFPGYYLFAVTSLIVITAYALTESVIWKRLVVLTIALCLLPPTSTEYKLLYFFIPFYYFINCSSITKFGKTYTILFALLFVNKGYIYFNGMQHITLNAVANTGIMLSMLLLIVFERHCHRLISILRINKVSGQVA